MLIRKISSILLAVAVTMSIFALYTTAVPMASAQTADQPQFCPIGEPLTVAFSSPAPEIRVDGQLHVESVQITNNSNYVLPGVRVGIGVYEDDLDAIPEFWTVAPFDLTLGASETEVVQMELDASQLSAGEYTYRVFTAQASESELLGHALIESTPSVQTDLIVVQPSSNKAALDLSINGEIASGQTFTISPAETINVNIETKNTGNGLMTESTVVGSLALGTIPLGAAVQADMTDSANPLPGRSRNSTFSHRNPFVGQYTVYASLITEGVLQPVAAAPVIVGDGEGVQNFAYIANVGLSEFPMQPGTDIVTCIDQHGPVEALAAPPVITDITVSDVDGNSLFEDRGVAGENGTFDYVSTESTVAAQAFTVSATISEKRFNNAEGQALIDAAPGDLVLLQSAEYTLDCKLFDNCDIPIQETIKAFSQEEVVRQSFWFYAGIVLAAALLMYLMLRRLHPEDHDELLEESSPDELK